jgi:hypothetical protein
MLDSMQVDNADVSFLQMSKKTQPLVELVTAEVYQAAPVGLLATHHLHIPYNHIARNITYHNLGEQIFTFPERRPREFNIMLATFKTWVADLIVQLGEQRRVGAKGFDWWRSVAFALFGLLYIGLMQWVLYVTILTSLFPDAMMFANAPWSVKLADTVGQLDMAGQILVDNMIFNVFIYFPAFYLLKAIVQGTDASFIERARQGLGKYWKNCVSDNMFSLAIWLPADLFIFAAPMYLRMPLEHSVSFGWTMFISATRGAVESKAESLFAEVEGEATMSICNPKVQG